MNFHYIEFMVKERQRQELEDCQRIRLLKTGRYFDAFLIKKIVLAIRPILNTLARHSFKESTLKGFILKQREVL